MALGVDAAGNDLFALQPKTKPVWVRRLGLVRTLFRYEVHITRAPHGANPTFVLIAQLRSQDVNTLAKVGPIKALRYRCHQLLGRNNVIRIHKQRAKECCRDRSKRNFSGTDRESPRVFPDQNIANSDASLTCIGSRRDFIRYAAEVLKIF